MGIFNFFKKKSTLLEDIKKSSNWMIKCMNYSGYNVDMSIESLKEVERFFCEQMDDETHIPIPGGLLSESIGSKIFAIGSLVGEIILKERGGQWITNDKDREGEINIMVQLLNGTCIFPVQRVMKRCAEGTENNIYHYAVSTTKPICR